MTMDTATNPAYTPEEEAFRREIHQFGVDVVRPAAIELDKCADPADVIAPGSLFWDVMRQMYRLGYHRRGFPEALGGSPQMSPIEAHIFSEEMGWASADFSIALGVAGFPFSYAAMSGNQELIEKFVKPFLADTEARYVGCWAITEPMHGSDVLNVGGEGFNDPEISYDLKARLDGDEWIISGQKSAWVSNGTIATHALTFLSVEPSQGTQGGGVAFIPLDLPGISRGKPLDKLGQRALNQGEIFFDDVRLPRDYMLVMPDTYPAVLEAVLAGANAGMSSTFTGVARAAFDEALAYAKQRVQGGKPIVEHQLVQKKLFEMFTKVEAARQLSRAVGARAAAGAGGIQYSIAAKTFCTQTAFEVASDAVQLHGGYGLTKDSVIEKIFRDARASMIEDGTNEVLSLIGARKVIGLDS
ncbi:MAG: acyl-CoA dehydrogenase family protein [Dehalococcoidia bacterium]